MRCKRFIIAVIVFTLYLSFNLSVTNAFDDDYIKLQNQQFKLQRQLREYELKMQRQQSRIQQSYNKSLSISYQPSDFLIDASSFDPMISMRSQMRMQELNMNPAAGMRNDYSFKLQRQQFKLQQQLMDQQFKMQRQQLKLQDSYNRSLFTNYRPSNFLIGGSSFSPMTDLRSQIQMRGLNTRIMTNNISIPRLNDSSLTRYGRFGSGIQSFNVRSPIPTPEQLRRYDNYWANGEYWTKDPYYADLARPAPDLTPENYIRAFGLTTGVIATDWARFSVDVAPGLDPGIRFGLQRLSVGARSYMINELAKYDPGEDITIGLNRQAHTLQTIGKGFGMVRAIGNLARSVRIQPYSITTTYQFRDNYQLTAYNPEVTEIISFSRTVDVIGNRSGHLVMIDGSRVAGVLSREALKRPLDNYMNQTGKAWSDSLRNSNISTASPITNFDTNRSFNSTNNMSSSSVLNSYISQQRWNRITIPQPNWNSINTSQSNWNRTYSQPNRNNYNISQPQLNDISRQKW